MSEAVEAVIDRPDAEPRFRDSARIFGDQKIKRSTCNDSVERVTHAQSEEEERNLAHFKQHKCKGLNSVGCGQEVLMLV